MADPIITTDRLILRRFEDADLDAYFALLSHPKVSRWLLPVRTREEAMRNMAMMEGFWALRGSAMMAIIRRDSDALIGRCGPWRPEIAEGRDIEVGWALHPDHQGFGFATEAAQAATDWAFGALTPPRIVHMIAAENTASQAVAARIGSRRTGETVPHPAAERIEIWAQEAP